MYICIDIFVTMVETRFRHRNRIPPRLRSTTGQNSSEYLFLKCFWLKLTVAPGILRRLNFFLSIPSYFIQPFSHRAKRWYFSSCHIVQASLELLSHQPEKKYSLSKSLQNRNLLFCSQLIFPSLHFLNIPSETYS